MHSAQKMSAIELRASTSLALIFFLRMLGLFLILPVFVFYAEELSDATPTLIGIAFGVYGLTQALFQIPFGMISDRIGRKPVITMGLIIFALGSVIAGMAESIWVVILGRMLQGTGAIAATVMALAADLTSESQRTKAMALIGISIGFAFALAFVAGPMLTPVIGVPGLFYLSAGFAFFALFVLFSLVPTPVSCEFHDDTETSIKQLNTVLRDSKLLHLNISIFTLHTLLMASFVVIPLALRDVAGLAVGQHWQIYLPAFIISALIMLPFLLLGEKYNKTRSIFIGAIIIMALSQLGLYLKHDSIQHLFFMLTIFFTAFNYLEATLPSLITKVVTPTQKGTALGVYTTSQFIGTFVGGLVGGYCYEHFDMSGVFFFGVVITVIWLLFALTMPNLTRQ